MSFMIFPRLVRGLTFTVMKTPTFDTLIESAANKYDFRLPQTVNPFWNWQLTYSYLKDFPWDLVIGLVTSDYRVMIDFFLAQQGQSGTFLFFDVDDNKVGPALINGDANVPLAELFVYNDGAGNYYSPLQRTFAGNFYEDITDLNLDPTTDGEALAIYSNSVLQVQNTDYTLATSPGLSLPTAAFMGLYVTWARLPLLNSGFAIGKTTGGSLAPAVYYVQLTRVASNGETLPGTEHSIAIGVGTPAAATLTQAAGGTDAAQTITVQVTYVNSLGETVGSTVATLAKSANNLLTIASPIASGDATGWNAYVGINGAGNTLVNGTPIPIGTSWVETTGGIPTGGAALPGATTALGRLTVGSVGSSGRTTDTGWNVYVGTSSGGESKQNSTKLAYGATYTEPTTGLIGGAAPPTIDSSSQPVGPISAQFGFYFRVRFGTDDQDFEKFMNRLWCIGGDFSKNGSGVIKLATSRPVPL